MNKVFSTIKKGVFYLQENGMSQTCKKVIRFFKEGREFDDTYVQWIENCEVEVESKIRKEIESFTYLPLFSVCIPVYNVEECWLRKCIDSVRAQYYERWELCIAEDCSANEHIREILKEYESKEQRIRVVYRKENGHISKATNSAIHVAEGEYIVLMDHDDEIAPFALFEAAKLLQSHKDADVIYSDEDKIDEEGKRKKPFFKPDYCPETLLSYNYISHLGVYRKSLVEQIGGFRSGIEGAQDYDLILRITECTDRVYHIPKILYHWRAIEGSTALDGGEKNYAYQAGKRVLEDAVSRRGYSADVVLLPKIQCYKVVFYPEKKHLISIIIPTKDKAEVLERCLASIYEKSKTAIFEIIIVDNNSKEQETFSLFEEYKKKGNFHVLTLPIPFNYSKINNEAVKMAKGDLLLFLNNDVEVITDDWLTLMAGEVERKEIGAVGVKLLYPNNTVQHAGVILGILGVAGHIGVGKDRDDNGYMSFLSIRKNYSAVTAACLMIRRDVFYEVGGFEETLQIAFNDVDFCIKVRESGYRNLFLGDVLLYHYESLSRGVENTPEKMERFTSEVNYMLEKWGEQFKADPCYNCNFDLHCPELKIKTLP